MKKYKFGIFAAALMVAFMASTGLVTKAVEAAVAACTTEVITNDDISRQAENTPPTRNWVYYTRTGAESGTFRTGPGSAPLGVGSFEMTTPTGADKATLFNYDHVGTALADINKMGYSTYRTTGNLQQVAALNLQVDYNGDAPGGFTTLVFEPVYNTDQGAVVTGEWQDWDAYNGGNAIWWSSNPIPGAPNRDTFVTLSTIVAQNPDAVILGGFGVNQGSGNPALTTAVDALSIGTAAACFVYNFDPYEVATDKEACKNDGWKTLKDADGNEFKNQGQCVSSVASGGKSGKKN